MRLRRSLLSNCSWSIAGDLSKQKEFDCDFRAI